MSEFLENQLDWMEIPWRETTHFHNLRTELPSLDAHDPIFRIACVVCNSLGIGAFVPMECFLCT